MTTEINKKYEYKTTKALLRAVKKLLEKNDLPIDDILSLEYKKNVSSKICGICINLPNYINKRELIGLTIEEIILKYGK